MLRPYGWGAMGEGDVAPIHIIRTRRKTIALIVQRDGTLLVRAPLRTSERQILELVKEQAEWVRSRQEIARQRAAAAPAKAFVEGEDFWYLGQVYKLAIVDAARPLLALDERAGQFRLARAAQPGAAAVFEAWYRRQARRVFAGRVTAYARQSGLQPKKLRVGGARTRWGSCSSKGTLSFTWRLVMAPLAAIDYVVVHELCHLQVKNHSREFWARVKAILPDYKEQVRWLKVNGHTLRID